MKTRVLRGKIWGKARGERWIWGWDDEAGMVLEKEEEKCMSVSSTWFTNGGRCLIPEGRTMYLPHVKSKTTGAVEQ